MGNQTAEGTLIKTALLKFISSRRGVFIRGDEVHKPTRILLMWLQPQCCHYSEHTFEPHLDAHLRTVHTRLVINLLSGLNNVCFESTTAFHGWPKIYISEMEYHINVYMSLLWTECYYK